jgi:hypothetical protein
LLLSRTQWPDTTVTPVAPAGPRRLGAVSMVSNGAAVAVAVAVMVQTTRRYHTAPHTTKEDAVMCVDEWSEVEWSDPRGGIDQLLSVVVR